MNVKTMALGDLQTNTYIITDESTKSTVIIDPAGDAVSILEYIKEMELNLKAILITHGHFDHFTGVSRLKNLYDVPVVAHKKEAERMEDANSNLSMHFYAKAITAHGDTYIEDGDTINYGGELVFKCIRVPGHTEDSICFYNDKDGILFSGDTLMARSIGRTDFYKGLNTDIITNIKEKLLVLPIDTVVYCGHGFSTTIGSEKDNNPYVGDNSFINM
jgi:glyoxylase-like metal-dependent hydrolase (beta-lactamase superfamily II)